MIGLIIGVFLVVLYLPVIAKAIISDVHKVSAGNVLLHAIGWVLIAAYFIGAFE